MSGRVLDELLALWTDEHTICVAGCHVSAILFEQYLSSGEHELGPEVIELAMIEL